MSEPDEEAPVTTLNPVFQETAMKSNDWLGEVMTALDIDDERRGLRALRAGLHTIRDYLPVTEAAHLGAQLPMLLRGLYYEGWRPGERPPRLRRQDELMAVMREHIGPDPALDPELTLRAVITVLAWRITGGELDDIASILPRPFAEVWADALA